MLMHIAVSPSNNKGGIGCIFVFFSPLQNLHTRKINNINLFPGVYFVWNEIIIVFNIHDKY